MKTKMDFVFGLPVVLLVLGLILVGCSTDAGGDDDDGSIDKALVGKWYQTQQYADGGDADDVIFELASDGRLTGPAVGANAVIMVTTSKGRISSTSTAGGATIDSGSADYVVQGSKLTFSNFSSTQPNILSILNAVTMGTGGSFYKKAGGGDGDKSGITFTGIASQYNGQYAMFRSSGGTTPVGGDYLIGSATSSGITGVRISGGSVTIPVYLANTADTTIVMSKPYSGSDKTIKIYLTIKNTASFTFDDWDIKTYTFDSVNFTNGSASVNVGGGDEYVDDEAWDNGGGKGTGSALDGDPNSEDSPGQGIDSALVAKWYQTQQYADGGDADDVIFELAANGRLTGPAVGANAVIKVTTSKGRISSTTTAGGATIDSGSADYVVEGSKLTFSNFSSTQPNILSMLNATTMGTGGSFYKKAGSGGAPTTGGSNPKTLVLTGITARQANQIQKGIIVLIAPPGPAGEPSFRDALSIAGADNGKNGGIAPLTGSAPYTVTAELHVVLYQEHFESRWTGSGTYDIYLYIYSETDYSDHPYYKDLDIFTLYRKDNVLFTTAETTVSVADFSWEGEWETSWR